jgi:REP element-mobilizing transposase RayT
VRLWYFLLVARFARVVALDTPHHVTQRGNARQFILTTDAERLVYLGLLRHYGSLHRLSLVGDCLMSNHVDLIVIPKQLDSLAATLKNTHGCYAAYWNAQQRRQTYRRIRHFGSNREQPVAQTSCFWKSAAFSREKIPQSFQRGETLRYPLAAGTSPAEAIRGVPIPDGRSAHRNLSKGWRATPAAPSLLRKAVQKGGRRAKLPASHGNQLSIFSGNVPFVPGFQRSAA